MDNREAYTMRYLLALGFVATVLVTGCGKQPHTDDATPAAHDPNADALLDVFPASVVQFPAEQQGSTVLSSEYTPSDSLWGKHLDERNVFNFELKHMQDEANSFTVRIGKGGQLYSLRGAFGESVPPQGVGNPWNDEVWQFVAVCGKFNVFDSGQVLSEEVNERFKAMNYGTTYFIHNSGAYMQMPVDSGCITLSYDVMLDDDSPGMLNCMLRDASGPPWRTFGNLLITESGISFNGESLAAARAGAWYRLQLEFELDEDGADKGVVRVRAANGQESVTEVPFAESPIRMFHWVGLSATGGDAGTIFVDNLEIRRELDGKTEWLTREDFDMYEPGDRVLYTAGADEEKGAVSLVSDRYAVSGKNSLEIRDAAGLEADWQPMLRLGLQSTGGDSLYCPLLGANIPDDGRTYRTVNWGIVPQLRTIHRSPILYYVQTRDVGEGVIEITYVVHNFSARDDVVFDWLNAPWGGTRITSLPYHYVSSADGELWDREKSVEMKLVNGISVRKTGGWNLSCATDADDSPSLALVFGRDRHLDAELERAAKGLPHCQLAPSIYRDMIGPLPDDLRKRPEYAWRNYDPAVVIPQLNLAPGKTIWYRSYLVVNSRSRAIELAKSLVDKVDYGYREFDPETTPMVSVALGAGGSPVKLFAHPVPGTMPVFLIENATTGRQVITTDPYIFVPQEKLDLGMPPEHPSYAYYSEAVGYSIDENNTNWKRLLGYAYRKQPAEGAFRRLSEVLDAEQFPEPNTYHVDLWVE
jgi:hypothetical protein